MFGASDLSLSTLCSVRPIEEHTCTRDSNRKRHPSVTPRSKWAAGAPEVNVNVAMERGRWEEAPRNVDVATERSKWEDAGAAATFSHLSLEATASQMGVTRAVDAKEDDVTAERRKWGAKPSETVVNALQHSRMTRQPDVFDNLVIYLFTCSFL